MYSKEQITFLMSSGFSLDEIMQMQAPSQPEPQPVENPVETVDNPAPQPDPDPAPAPRPAVPQDGTAQILQALAGLTQAVQMQNIRQVGFGAPPEQRDVNQVLGEIINPPRPNK